MECFGRIQLSRKIIKVNITGTPATNNACTQVRAGHLNLYSINMAAVVRGWTRTNNF